MSLKLNADETFEIAMQIERNGAAFYRKAAGFASDPEAKTFLTELARMEDDHERTFSRLYAQSKAVDFFDPDGEGALYLQAMAQGKIFDPSRDPSDFLTGNETLADILRYSIGMEKDSILFYLGMRDATQQAADRDRIQAIIEEEKRHLVLLSRTLKTLES